MRSNQIKARPNGYFILHMSPKCVVLGAFCCSTVRIPSYSRLDRSRNCRVGAPINHAFDFLIFRPHVPLPPFQLSMLTHRLLKHWRKIPANESHPLPPPQPPAFPFSLPLFPLFLHISGNNDLHLATAVRHQYALYSITSLFLCIFLTFFRTFSYTSGTTTPRIPTPYQHRSLFITDHDLVVGTENVFKQPPFKDSLVSHSLLVSI